MNMEISIAEENYAKDWDELIAGSPHGIIFNHWDWLRAAAKQADAIFYPVIVSQGSTVAALYPIFLKKSIWFNVAYTSPEKAMLLYSGPVFIDYEKFKMNKKAHNFFQIQKKIDELLLGELRCAYINIRLNPGIFDARPLIWAGYQVEPYYTYRIPLTEGIDKIWSRFDRKLRVAINRAKKEKITIKKGGISDIDRIYSLLNDRYSQQGLNIVEYQEYLHEVLDRYQQNVNIFTASFNENNLTGIITLSYKDTLLLWMGIPKQQIKGIAINDLLLWEVIQWAHDKGYRYFENMDSGIFQRLNTFKAKYDPDLQIYFNARKFSSNLIGMGNCLYKQVQRVFSKDSILQ